MPLITTDELRKYSRNHPAYKILNAWLLELHSDFGDDAPDPRKLANLILASEHVLETSLKKYLGGGDNGKAFLTGDKTVAKFTIDAKEAQLWAQLVEGGDFHQHIATCLGCWHLCSRINGESIVYLVHTEFVPRQLPAKLVAAIDEANRLSDTAVAKGADRAAIQAVAYRKVAETSGLPQLSAIADLVLDMSRRGVLVFDLQPNNFMLTDGGTIKMVDPSVPKGPTGKPETLNFEQKLVLALRLPKLYF